MYVISFYDKTIFQICRTLLLSHKIGFPTLWNKHAKIIPLVREDAVVWYTDKSKTELGIAAGVYGQTTGSWD